MKTQISKSIFLLPALLLLTFGLTSCDKRIRKKGSGVVVTNSRSVSDFTSVDVEGEYSVYTYSSDQPHVEVTTDDNIMSDVRTFVQDGKLFIEMNDDYLNYKPTQMSIRIYGSDLSAVDLNGDVDFTMYDTTQVSSFNFYLNGSGNAVLLAEVNNSEFKVNGSGSFKVSGASSNTKLEINGSGRGEALYLSSSVVNAKVNGSGKIYANCQSTLNAAINGSGDIYYTGSPVISSTISGSGTVSPY